MAPASSSKNSLQLIVCAPAIVGREMPIPEVSPERSQRFCFLRATRRGNSLSVLSMRILRTSSWNDDRLDEFSRSTDDRLGELSRRTDEGFREIRQDMKVGFARIDRLTNTLLGGTLAVIVAIIVTGILG